MKTFTLTQEHLSLLRRMYVGWCGDEFGAPEIDPKRPYGDGDVLGSMAEILDIPLSADPWDRMAEEAEDRLRKLHQETETALQIVLRNITGRVPVGRYAASDYGTDWVAQ